jgi:hypothetical protein
MATLLRGTFRTVDGLDISSCGQAVRCESRMSSATHLRRHYLDSYSMSDCLLQDEAKITRSANQIKGFRQSQI